MKNGIVFDIKQFAVFDGPGVRQTVFLKGCPLRCNWCHNPEGLSIEPQLMVSIASCQHCGKCKEVCKHEHCIACGECVPVCPLHLRTISGERISSEELERRLRKDSDYYAQLGGGVTFSGGDPLYPGNRDCIIKLIKKIKRLCPGKNIWLYTGYKWEDICTLDGLELIDVLVDGRFEKDLKDVKLHWKGSSNQRVIDVKETLRQGEIVLFD